MVNKVRKVGSGRTKGAVSSCIVSLEILNKNLKSNAKVMVNRRWAKMLLLKGYPIKSTTENISGYAEKVAA